MMANFGFPSYPIQGLCPSCRFNPQICQQKDQIEVTNDQSLSKNYQCLDKNPLYLIQGELTQMIYSYQLNLENIKKTINLPCSCYFSLDSLPLYQYLQINQGSQTWWRISLHNPCLVSKKIKQKDGNKKIKIKNKLNNK